MSSTSIRPWRAWPIGRRRELHARSLRVGRGPGHRRPADREGAVRVRVTVGTTMPARRQRATVEHDGTIVMRGSQRRGRHQGRAAVRGPRPRDCQGGTRSATAERTACAAPNSSRCCLTAATNFRRYDDVGGDPDAVTPRSSGRGRASPGTRCGARTSRSTSGCSAECRLDLGTSRAARAADR